MPKADAATSATVGHFYIMVQHRGCTFWLSLEFTKRRKRKMLVLTTSALFAEAFTTEELPQLASEIWKQFKGAEILPLECNTRTLVSSIMRKSINV